MVHAPSGEKKTSGEKPTRKRGPPSLVPRSRGHRRPREEAEHRNKGHRLSRGQGHPREEAEHRDTGHKRKPGHRAQPPKHTAKAGECTDISKTGPHSQTTEAEHAFQEGGSGLFHDVK